MTDDALLYTPSEAGAVSGLKLKAVHNAIDKRIVEPVANARVTPDSNVNPVAPRFLTGSASGGRGWSAGWPGRRSSSAG